MVQQGIKLVSQGISLQGISDLHALSRSRLFQKTKCGISNADTEKQVGRLGADAPFLSAPAPAPPGKAGSPELLDSSLHGASRQTTDT